MKSVQLRKIGVFDEPKQIKWSVFHGLFIVMGRRSIYTYDLTSNRQRVVYSSNTHEFTDMDISSEGYLALSLKGPSQLFMVKLITPNFFTISQSMPVEDKTIRKIAFVSGKILLVTSDSPGDDSLYKKTIFSLLSPYGGKVEWTEKMYAEKEADIGSGKGTKGSVISIIPHFSSGNTFIITEEGETWIISGSLNDTKSYSINYVEGSIGSGINLAVGGFSKSDESDAPQEKVRIFVGSREWGNDMWDSGEIATSLSSIPYGGGDNLKPGYKYWVHIMTYHSDSGWSRPQISSFIIPKD